MTDAVIPSIWISTTRRVITPPSRGRWRGPVRATTGAGTRPGGAGRRPAGRRGGRGGRRPRRRSGGSGAGVAGAAGTVRSDRAGPVDVAHPHLHDVLGPAPAEELDP